MNDLVTRLRGSYCTGDTCCPTMEAADRIEVVERLLRRNAKRNIELEEANLNLKEVATYWFDKYEQVEASLIRKVVLHKVN